MSHSLSRQNSRAQNIETPSDGHTGLSLAFDDWAINFEEDETKDVKVNENVPGKKIVKAKKSDDAKDTGMSKGVVCVVHRKSASGKVVIKRHAIQTSFFAMPSNASKDDKKKVDEKVKSIIAEYEANKYVVNTYNFDLPFDIDAIGKITTGYTTCKAKALSVTDVKKRKKADADSDDEVMPKGKKRALADEPLAKKAKAV